MRSEECAAIVSVVADYLWWREGKGRERIERSGGDGNGPRPRDSDAHKPNLWVSLMHVPARRPITLAQQARRRGSALTVIAWIGTRARPVDWPLAEPGIERWRPRLAD